MVSYIAGYYGVHELLVIIAILTVFCETGKIIGNITAKKY